MKKSELDQIIKEEIDKVLIEQVDVDGHLAQDAFNKKVLPRLNKKLKYLRAKDEIGLEIKVTAATGYVEKALEKMRETLDDPGFEETISLDVQIDFLARYIQRAKSDMRGAAAFTKAIHSKYKKFKKETSGPSKVTKKPGEKVVTTDATFANHPLLLQQAGARYRLNPSAATMDKLRAAAEAAVASGQVKKDIALQVLKVATDTENKQAIAVINNLLGI